MRRATVVVKHDSVKRRVAEMSELDTELIFRPLRNIARVASYAIGREVVSDPSGRRRIRRRPRTRGRSTRGDWCKSRGISTTASGPADSAKVSFTTFPR
jgi:hypothetical protein